MPKRGTDDAWTQAWSTRYGAEEKSAKPRARRRLSLRGGSRTGRYAVLGSVLVAVIASPFAVAATTGSRVTSDDARYSFIARNTRAGDGGAAALACQSDTGSGREPCLNMVNKGNGPAAAFRTRGLTGFRLQTTGTGTATPFVLDPNATGQVKYLNADQIDGKSADEIGRELFARVNVNADNTVAVSRGNGVATQNAVTRVGEGDFRVTFANDVNNCSYQVTNGDPDLARVGAADVVAGNNKQVRVTTRTVGGASAGDPSDAPFNLAVNC
jgi:hypothetical protein